MFPLHAEENLLYQITNKWPTTKVYWCIYLIASSLKSFNFLGSKLRHRHRLHTMCEFATAYLYMKKYNDLMFKFVYFCNYRTTTLPYFSIFSTWQHAILRALTQWPNSDLISYFMTINKRPTTACWQTNSNISDYTKETEDTPKRSTQALNSSVQNKCPNQLSILTKNILLTRLSFSTK